MYKSMLPIGSVVLIKGGEKKVMICARIQTRSGDDRIYDYCGCHYPEGIVAANKMLFFDRDDIERVYFIGFQDEEELSLRKNVFEKLGELTIRDNKIVSKEM